MKDSVFALNVGVLSAGSVVGCKEHQGPLGNLFDMHDVDDKFGQETWEMAESEMQRRALAVAMQKWDKDDKQLGAILAGDLLNQCVGSAYGMLEYGAPYFGLYGACSTAALGLMLGAVLVDGGHVRYAAAVTSSHNSAAERQYRTPLEYGAQRTPTAQWTVTGASAFVLGNEPCSVRIIQAMPGIPIEMGIRDAANMGAAMAPAACDTLFTHFKETGLHPNDYDIIVTGDLGTLGSRIFKDLIWEKGYDVEKQHVDCGELVYNLAEQEYQGGSGAGCSALVFNSFIVDKLKKGKYKKVLLMATGALLSSVSAQQGDSIPGIAHAVCVEGE